jgi:pyruvate carboxylase
MPPVEPETSQAPAGVPRASFVDAFTSTPGTPSALTGHVFPTVNKIRRGMGGKEAGEPLKKLMVANRGVSGAYTRAYREVR